MGSLGFLLKGFYKGYKKGYYKGNNVGSLNNHQHYSGVPQYSCGLGRLGDSGSKRSLGCVVVLRASESGFDGFGVSGIQISWGC